MQLYSRCNFLRDPCKKQNWITYLICFRIMYVVGFRGCQQEGWARDLSRETREEIGHSRINSLSLFSCAAAIAKRLFCAWECTWMSNSGKRECTWISNSGKRECTWISNSGKRKTKNTRETTYTDTKPLRVPDGIEVRFARRQSTAKSYNWKEHTQLSGQAEKEIKWIVSSIINGLPSVVHCSKIVFYADDQAVLFFADRNI